MDLDSNLETLHTILQMTVQYITLLRQKNWRVSLTLTDDTTSLKTIKKLIGRNNTVKLMGILAPGGGHLIIGEKYRGILFFGLTNLFLKAAEKETHIAKTAFILSGAGVYIYSLIDLSKTLHSR